MAHPTSDTKTELMDSLMHTNVPRMILGVICGVASGALLLALTMLFPPADMPKFWWIQFMATIVYGGNAMDFELTKQVLITGCLIHLALSCLCGLIMGKMTTSKNTFRLGVYGLVLGALCWLATNMFGPNFLDWQTLQYLGQWYRGGLYVIFGVSLGVFLAIGSRTLPE